MRRVAATLGRYVLPAIVALGATVGTSSASLASTGWPLPVAQAMKLVASRSRLVPLLAPRSIRDPIDHCRCYVGAKVESTRSSYMVNLEWTYVPLPPNSQELAQPQYANTGDGGIIGSFGATRYASADVAQTKITALLRSPSPPPARRMTRTMWLIPGVRAKVWPKFGALTWRENGVGVLLTSPTFVPDYTLARQVADTIQTLGYPSKDVAVDVDEGGDGEHTYVEWRVGAVLFMASNYHVATAALQMATSMAPWSSR